MPDKFVSKIITPFGERLIKAAAVTDDVKNALKNIFIAEIGVTPYNDVLSAYNNDKTIIGKISENTPYGVKTSYYPLLEYVTDSDEGDYFFFGLATNGNLFTYWNLHILGGWGSKTTSHIVEIDDSLDFSSTNPVKNAAVYAAINGIKSLEFINLSTTFAQVGTILESGKLPILVEYTTPNSPNYYSLINDNGGTEYIFGNISGTINRTYTLSGGGWTLNSSISFENSSNKVTAWSGTPSDTKYPSEKLVFDSLGMKYNGSKTESDIENGKFTIDGQNSTTKLTLTSVSTLTIVSNVGVPNFAITIDNSANASDVSISVKTRDELTTLYHSTAGGMSIAAGSIVQITAVGDCWTLAEFTQPTP